MRRIVEALLVLALSALLLGCPPPDGEEGAGPDPATDGGPRDIDLNSEEEVPDIDEDLRHVKVGQEYYFTRNEPMPRTEETWTITKIVKNREIHIDRVTRYVLPDGSPHVDRSEGIEPIPPKPPEGEYEELSDVLRVNGVAFECKRYKTEEGVTTWFSDKFPFTIKQEDDNGNQVRALAMIKQPPEKTKTAEK